MLLNQARNLTSLPYSSQQAIQQSLTRTQQLLNQAQRLAYDVDQIDRAFQRLYPDAYSSSTSSERLAGDAKERWQTSQAAFQDSLRVQAGVVQSLDTTHSETDALVSGSQSAVGALQAAQAGNQLTALQIKQLAELTALVAAQARAENLAGARNTASQEQARAQISRFLTSGPGYQAQSVQLFQ
jgi:type IV secretion system protein TrbJ